MKASILQLKSTSFGTSLFGVLVFLLTAVRLLWVAVRPALGKVNTAKSMQAVSISLHIAFWILILALSTAALIALGSEGSPQTLLGGFRIEHFPLIADSFLESLLDWGDVHEFLGDALIWLAGLHAVAVVYDGFVLKGDVLRSMLLYKGIR